MKMAHLQKQYNGSTDYVKLGKEWNQEKIFLPGLTLHVFMDPSRSEDGKMEYWDAL